MSEECLAAARSIIEDAMASEKAEAPVTEELNPMACEDPAYYDADVEFCANAGGVDTEGSATIPDEAFVEYPDCLRAEIVGVQSSMTDAYLSDHPDHDAEATVTVKLTNSGTQPILLSSDVTDILLYGENRYEAQSWMVMEAPGPSSDELPQQLVPGSSAEWTTVYSLPASGLTELAFTVSPNSSMYTEYTFTEVETLITG